MSQVRLRTHSDCELEVSVYPGFAYNAVGGGGYAQVEDLGNGLLRLIFDPNVRIRFFHFCRTVLIIKLHFYRCKLTL